MLQTKMFLTRSHFSVTIRYHQHLTNHKWMIFLAIIHNFKCHNNSNSNLNRKPNHPKPNSNFNPNHLSHLQPKLFSIPNTKKNNLKKGKADPRRQTQKEEIELAKHGSTYPKMEAWERVSRMLNCGTCYRAVL